MLLMCMLLMRMFRLVFFFGGETVQYSGLKYVLQRFYS